MGKFTPSNAKLYPHPELSPGPRTATSLPPHLKMSQASSIFPHTPEAKAAL